MRKMLFPFLLAAPLMLHPAFAETYHTSNLLKDAVTSVHQLADGTRIILSGETDGEPLVAEVEVGENGMLTDLTIRQGDRALRMPADAWNERSGAKYAWLEERGSLTTLVLEGEEEDGRDWRLALLFHPEQLWKRRLSIEGDKSDLFTFYSREDMSANEAKRRGAHNKGLYIKKDN